jgi:hypothetical protein
VAATTGLAAGVETSATQLSYIVETAWGVAPASAFTAIRYTSESLGAAKTRQRPAEISGTREAAQGVTTQQQATGTINYALSYGTFDDFLGVCLQSEWGALTTITGSAADITLTNTAGVITITSGTSSKFDAVVALSWIRLKGFTNTANNGFWFVTVKTSGTSLTVKGPNTGVTETPALAAAIIKTSSIKNSTTFRTLYIQEELASNMFLVYAGSYVSRMTVQGGAGAFLAGAIDIVAKSEAKGTTNASTGAVSAAPTGRVFDPIAGWEGVYWNEAAFGSAIDNFSLTMTNTGASTEFAMGSAAAAGILGGIFEVAATVRTYFKDFTQYDLFQGETTGRFALICKDPSGNAYAFTFLQAVLSVKLSVGGPGQPVWADVAVEAGPSGSGTFVIDRLAA